MSTQYPAHYTFHPTHQPFQFAELAPYHVGTAVAYVWRAGRKPGATVIQDYSKALHHLQMFQDQPDIGFKGNRRLTTGTICQVLEEFETVAHGQFNILDQLFTYIYTGNINHIFHAVDALNKAISALNKALETDSNTSNISNQPPVTVVLGSDSEQFRLLVDFPDYLPIIFRASAEESERLDLHNLIPALRWAWRSGQQGRGFLVLGDSDD